MYILGWTYWDSYLDFFGISNHFLDLSFHQIIATTWWIIILIIYILCLTIGQEVLDAKNLNGFKLPKSNIVRFPVIVIWIFVFFSSSAKWLKIATIIIGAILYIIADWIFKGKDFDIGNHFIKSRSSILFALLSIFGCLFIVYGYLGEYNAKRLAQGLSGNKIKFDYTEKLNLPNGLYLISYSKNKYFVCSKTTDGSKPKVFAIDNSKITKVEMVQ